LITQGLQPNHKLLDLGCGCLRGGVKFINYLEQGNYIDINESLLIAGKLEVENSGLTGKLPTLLRSEVFASDLEIGRIDFAISISLFTHLPISYVQEIKRDTPKFNLTLVGLHFRENKENNGTPLKFDRLSFRAKL
jgi:hypothetical protein